MTLTRSLVLAAVLTLAAPAAGAAPDVVLITVDTLRPDALGWVSGHNTTPVLDRLAREGFRFPAAIAPVPITLPSHISMMTGLVPRRHGVRDNGQVLGTAPALLAERLRAAGYTTAAFVSGYPLKGLFGLERGFDHYDDEVSVGDAAWLERPAADTTAAALAWTRSARRPFFLWVHYYDPHYPYTPPADLVRPGVRGTYDGEVALVDREIGRLLGGLPAGARLTVFTGDHGESLGEHGEGTHGFFIYDSTVLVPLVVHFPGQVNAGESRAAARLVDIAPTVLDLLGHSLGDAGIDGVSLVPTLMGREQEIPPAYVETRQPWTSYGWSPLRSVRHGGWKLIAAPRPELYDLVSDPGEAKNLVREERGKAHALKARLDGAEALPEVQAVAAADPETLAALEALGYVGGGASVGKPGPGLADPKDHITTRETLTRADEALRRGDYQAALALFSQVLEVDADNRFAVSRSGEALLRAGDLPGAIARLKQGARLDPRRPEIRQLLGEALTQAGDLEGAAQEWMELVRLQPGEARAWSNLGAVLGKAGRIAEAVDAMKRAVELEPGDPNRLTRLAFAEHAAGRLDDAVAHLKEVAALAGERFAHNGALGLLLLKQGKAGEARPYLTRCRPNEGEFPAARVELAVLEGTAGNSEAARRILGELLEMAPQLRPRLASDPRLTSWLP